MKKKKEKKEYSLELRKRSCTQHMTTRMTHRVRHPHVLLVRLRHRTVVQRLQLCYDPTKQRPAGETVTLGSQSHLVARRLGERYSQPEKPASQLATANGSSSAASRHPAPETDDEPARQQAKSTASANGLRAPAPGTPPASGTPKRANIF